MKKSFLIQPIAVAIVFFATQSAFGQEKEPQFGKDPINDIVKKMTLDEKVKVLVGKGYNFPGMESNDRSPDKIPNIAGHTMAIPKFGIPSISMADGPNGLHKPLTKQDSANNLYSTAWPVGTLLASSWDTALVKKVGAAFGGEIKAYGIDFILAPGINIQRNPLNGRNYEYFSEDPLVSGSMAAAMINGIQSHGVGATIKHFAANNEETNRRSVNVIVSERALREIYLRNFEIGIKNSHPWAVMTSYNLLNGTYTSESRDLVTTILRDEWGFKGFVMSDWFGGQDPVAQMNAGNNMIMPGMPAQVKAITEAVKSGKISEGQLDKNVEEILNVTSHTLTAMGYNYPNKTDLKALAQLSRDAAAQSMVLLKNNGNVLPFRKSGANIALFGNHGYDLLVAGMISGEVNKPYAISLAEGLTNAGYRVDGGLAEMYKNYTSDYAAKHPKKAIRQEMANPTPPAPEFKPDQSLIDEKANSLDMAIIYIGRNAGESRDRIVTGDYELTGEEKETITNIVKAFHARHKPVIAILNIAGVTDVTAFRDKVDAILLAWEPGEEGGNAITDVLSGKVNPSGKLAQTFPMAYNDLSSAKNFPGKELAGQAATTTIVGRAVPSEVTYQEGIYVGYRYFNTFKVKPAYEFGFGLSYTNFSYSKLTLSNTSFKGNLTASVTITNTGSVAGKEVAELYL